MKKALKAITPLIFVLVIIVVNIGVISAAGNISTLSWNLVDSTKHLDYAGSTKYLSSVNFGKSLWNAYKAGVIRVSSGSAATDVTLSDYYQSSSAVAVTSSQGTIKFNKYYMDTYTIEKKRMVCAHELGHALGLAHNLSGSIMYAYVTSVNILSVHDKASYDYCYTFLY